MRRHGPTKSLKHVGWAGKDTMKQAAREKQSLLRERNNANKEKKVRACFITDEALVDACKGNALIQSWM